MLWHLTLGPSYPLLSPSECLQCTAPSQTSLDNKLALALPLTPVSSSDFSDEAIVSNLVDKSHAILDFLRVEMPVHLLLWQDSVVEIVSVRQKEDSTSYPFKFRFSQSLF